MKPINAYIFRCICTMGLATAALQGSAQQHLSLESTYQQARENYPLSKQRELIAKSRDYSMDNATKALLPQLSIGGQASYQSDVTQVPIRVPGMSIPTMSKDQYKVFAEVNQPLFDWTLIHQQRKLVDATAAVEEQKLEVELYKLRERITQLYFGILLIKEQLQQSELVKNDIDNALKKTQAAIANGIALRANADVLRAELLKLEQRTIELETNRRAYLDVLGLFLNQTLADNTVLDMPVAVVLSDSIQRPELNLFAQQARSFEVQQQVLNARNLPRLGAFVQGGYGRPGLNMLNNEFQTYYIAGVRLNWSLSGLYTLRKDKLIQGFNRDNVLLQRETFLFNTHFAMKQQNGEITKLQKLMSSDEQIIALRENVKKTASVQLENGTITASDYLREVNAEDQARQNKILHQLQLSMARYNYATTTGN